MQAWRLRRAGERCTFMADPVGRAYPPLPLDSLRLSVCCPPLAKE